MVHQMRLLDKKEGAILVFVVLQLLYVSFELLP